MSDSRVIVAITATNNSNFYQLFGPLWSAVKLEGRQRPRKGVRLGRRGRRLALGASIAEALDLVRQKRLDRREMGNV